MGQQLRLFRCSSHTRLPRAKPANHIAPERCTKKAQGKVQNQHLNVRCRSSQDQEPSVQQTDPNISRLAPGLQQQWDHAANAHLGPIDIKPKSDRKVWWTCDQCPDGHMHSWEATVAHRSNGTGCPQCAGRKVCKHNSLATKAPQVAAQWDYEANAGTPDNVVAQSNHPVGWLCEVCGDQWSISPHRRVSKNKTGCPQCAHNANGKKRMKHPTFAECQEPHSKAVLAEWDHERNAPNRNFPHNTRLRRGANRSSGSATSARQGSSTAGLQRLIAELAASSQAAHSVLGRLLADATPYKRCTLP